MDKNSKSHVYGPVPSRRLGRSLGVDLVPFKICNYDCIYCQLGRTKHKVNERKEYASPANILSDLNSYLQTGDRPDYITISGSGEPTLNSGLDEIVKKIRKLCDIPLAILTNGSLLSDKIVRSACLKSDLIIPSLDAGDASMFKHVNRPHEDIAFENVIEGLIRLREEYRGKIWLEVFLLAGVNGIKSEVKKIKRHVDRIDPDKLQINTVARPPAEDYAYGLDDERLLEYSKVLGRKSEIIASFSTESERDHNIAKRGKIIELISRRPCSVEDIADGLNVHPNEVIKHVDELISDPNIVQIRHHGRVFYKIKTDTED